MSKQRAKGTSFETAIVRYLQENGFQYAERRALHGEADKGDITGTPGLAWECKNHKTLKISEWIRETEQERINAKAEYGFLIVKRAGVGNPGEQYAMMTLDQLCRLLGDAGYGKREDNERPLEY